ncbi:HET-domain-containing protein, partial [Lophiostoma macrostomum CBS 122681]
MSRNSDPLYRRLGNNQIRLLSLQRGKHDDPLKCFLIILTGAEQDGLTVFENRFTALSYTWGDQNDPLMIGLNGHKVPVGRNLASALVGARMENTDCIIWVDALCINQDDEIEKSHQIQLMPTIYELAAFTIIWLG